MKFEHEGGQFTSAKMWGTEDQAFHLLAEAIPHIVYIADADGSIVYFNERWYAYIGAQPHRHAPDSWLAAIHPEDRPLVLATWTTVRPTGKPFEFETRIGQANGDYRWHLNRCVPVTGPSGSIVNWFGTATDIDDLKRAEARIAASESRFRALIEKSKDVIALSDAAGETHYITPSVTTVLGYLPEEVTAGSRVARIHPDDWSMQQQVFAEVAATPNESRTLEVRYWHKEGRWIWIEGTLTNLLDDPDIAAIVLNFRDITNQHQSADSLRFLAKASKVLASSLDYRTTLTTVASLVVPEIADWCSVEMRNEAGGIEQLAVAHVDPAKVQWARELHRANPPDPDAPTGLPQVLRTGESAFFPYIPDELLVATARNEEELALARLLGLSSILIVPLLVEGKAIGAITFVAAESGRRYTLVDLAVAEEVASRAALAIENARLYTASQRAIGIRDEFISMASHELKTPVTSLKMYTQVLERQFVARGETVVAERLAKMNGQVNKLTTLIDDLLDVTRFQRSQLALREDSFDLNALVHEIVENTQATTTKHTITVEGSITRAFYGDRERIGQVITNLLTNAIKYSPAADRIILCLETRNDAAVVSVQDFGIGIDTAHLAHLFERFYRVTDPAEKTYPGLGLGLYITHGIVERHGGSINVQSIKGAGSTFTVTLPFRDAGATAETGEKAE